MHSKSLVGACTVPSLSIGPHFDMMWSHESFGDERAEEADLRPVFTALTDGTNPGTPLWLTGR